jgi:hypothetical protein
MLDRLAALMGGKNGGAFMTALITSRSPAANGVKSLRLVSSAALNRRGQNIRSPQWHSLSPPLTELRPMRQTAKIALAHFTCILFSRAGARELHFT